MDNETGGVSQSDLASAGAKLAARNAELKSAADNIHNTTGDPGMPDKPAKGQTTIIEPDNDEV